MFRISLIVCALLILGVTATPLSKGREEGSQEVIVSLDETGRMLRGQQVEPPEDMDSLQFNIDPRMKIWKGLNDGGKQPPVAEEDLDELHHPFIDVQDQNEGFPPVADTKAEPFGERVFEEPEQDMDELYHRAMGELEVYLAPLMAKDRTGALSEPEQDSLDQPAQAEALRKVRVHLQPEEDRDDLHHLDLRFLQNRGFPQAAAAPVRFPSQRKHAEPEEDRDGLYHQ